MNQPNPSDRISNCVHRVEMLSREKLPPDQYLPQFLQIVLEGCQAPAGAIWKIDQSGLRPIAEHNLANAGVLKDQPTQQKNAKMLAEVINNAQTLAIGNQGTRAELRPTPHVFICGPLFEEKKCVAVLQLIFPEAINEEARKGLLQFTEHLVGLASLYLSGKMTSPIAINSRGFWEQIDRFLLDLHNGLETHQVASTAANDLRQILAVDRAAVISKWGRKTKVLAVSGQDKVNRQSNLMQKLNKLVAAVYATGQPFIYQGELNELAPQVERLLADYLEESNARMIAIYPLQFKTREHQAEDRPQDKAKPPVLMGAMVLELLSSKQWDAERQAATEMVADHIATALHNSEDHERIFLLPVWRTIGKGVRALRGRVLAKTIAVLATLLFILLALIFVPYDYRATGDGRLMPVVQRDVFATRDAEIEEILVTGGQDVKKDQLLVQLKDPELQTQFLRVDGEIQEKRLLVRAQEAELDLVSRQGQQGEAVRLQGRIAETRAELASLEKEQAILEGRIEKLKVYSPIDGVIATFQLKKLLQNRPVRRGDILMEVMDPEQAWHLELEVKDKRMGHILKAQHEQNSSLDVEYILATDPETTYQGALSRISTRSSVNQESSHVVEVIAEINEENLPELRIGAEVKGKIDCGKMPLGYVLFGDAWDFIRVTLWL